MSELQVNKIRSYSSSGAGTLTIDCGGLSIVDTGSGDSTNAISLTGTLTSSGLITANGGITLGGGLDCASQTITNVGAFTSTSLISSGGLSSVGVTDLGTSGQVTASKLKVGSGASAGTNANDLGVAGKVVVDNDDSAATALSVASGNVDLASSDSGSVTSAYSVTLDTAGALSFGGTSYDADDFLGFGGASFFKGFAVINVDLSGTNTSSFQRVAGSVTGTLSSTTTAITIPHTAMSVDRCVLLTWTGEPDDGDKVFYVSSTSSTTATVVTLRNGDSNETGTKLHVLFLD